MTALVLLLCSVNVYAVSVQTASSGKTVITVGDWVYERVDNGTHWELDEYVGAGGKVYVPRTLSDSLVVSMGDHCFMNNTEVTSVVTSPPLWTIGEYSFIDCTSLESIFLNYALKTIEAGAFSGTSALKDVNLQDTVVTEIKANTFLNSGIEDIELPETCTKIGHNAFAQCLSLGRIKIPATVTEIADTAFKGSENAVIECYNNSYAMRYAIDHGIDYDVIDPLKGDFDGDGFVTVNDATYIQMNDVGMSLSFTVDKHALKRGEVTGDGEVDVRDATMIQMKLANMISSFD